MPSDNPIRDLWPRIHRLGSNVPLSVRPERVEGSTYALR